MGDNHFLLLTLVVIPIVSGYVILRIIYWTCCANTAIYISLDRAIKLFIEVNQSTKNKAPYFEEAPHTAILQTAIRQDLETHKKEKVYPFYKRLAIKTARPKALVKLGGEYEKKKGLF